MADALFIDGKPVRFGPPPKLEELRRRIGEEVALPPRLVASRSPTTRETQGRLQAAHVRRPAPPARRARLRGTRQTHACRLRGPPSSRRRGGLPSPTTSPRCGGLSPSCRTRARRARRNGHRRGPAARSSRSRASPSACRSPSSSRTSNTWRRSSRSQIDVVERRNEALRQARPQRPRPAASSVGVASARTKNRRFAHAVDRHGDHLAALGQPRQHGRACRRSLHAHDAPPVLGSSGRRARVRDCRCAAAHASPRSPHRVGAGRAHRGSRAGRIRSARSNTRSLRTRWCVSTMPIADSTSSDAPTRRFFRPHHQSTDASCSMSRDESGPRFRISSSTYGAICISGFSGPAVLLRHQTRDGARSTASPRAARSPPSCPRRRAPRGRRASGDRASPAGSRQCATEGRGRDSARRCRSGRTGCSRGGGRGPRSRSAATQRGAEQPLVREQKAARVR